MEDEGGPPTWLLHTELYNINLDEYLNFGTTHTPLHLFIYRLQHHNFLALSSLSLRDNEHTL